MPDRSVEERRLKAANIRFEDKVVLPAVQRCDGSKVFPSGNQHLQRCCLPTKGGVTKGRPYKCTPHLTPQISVSGSKALTSTELQLKSFSKGPRVTGLKQLVL
uniref:SJCHGC04667 protein n=1 Tax=Schistosoma japonicum TaxID=6182 RepID=Q5DAD1_SCHJA|nr:SJCHGC04667 protein [Schistosoma japonicum]